MRDYYISRFELNASHSVREGRSESHNHTFHIAVYIGNPYVMNGEHVNLNIAEAEYRIEKYLERFSGQFLNEVPEIKSYGSDVEGLGKFFYEAIQPILKDMGYELYQLDFSDNRLNSFQVSDTINLPVLSLEDGTSNFEVIVRQQDHFRNKK